MLLGEFIPTSNCPHCEKKNSSVVSFLSVLLSITLGLITPPPDRLMHNLILVIFSICRYRLLTNPFFIIAFTTLPSAGGLQGLFGFSEKQRLLSSLQNYRVWSSGEISLSSQFSFTLPPPKLLFWNHLLIKGVNDMRCQDPPPIFQTNGTCAMIQKIQSNTQTSEQCLLLISNKGWFLVYLKGSETSVTFIEQFAWINM